MNRPDLERNWAFAPNQIFAAIIIVVDAVGENADRRAVGLVPDGEAVVVFNQSGAIKTVPPCVVLQRRFADAGPEAGYSVPFAGVSGGASARDLALIDRVLPMFNRYRPAGKAVVGKRDITCCKDVFDRRTHLCVDNDPAFMGIDASLLGRCR